jgi:transcription factor E2F7/8
MGEKPKAKNGVTVVVSPTRKTLPNKRAFGTELTNIDITKSKLNSTSRRRPSYQRVVEIS